MSIHFNVTKQGITLVPLLQALSQLTNYLGHFPFNTGAVRPQSRVMEYEDCGSNEEELTPAIFERDNVQVLLFPLFKSFYHHTL